MTEVETETPVVEPETETYVPPFPIGIALIGAPTSGKQEVMEEFHAIAHKWFIEQGSCLGAVFNPGEAIPDLYDQATGVYGSYREDLWVFFERLGQESAFRKDNISFISSGTIIECMAHCGVGLEQIMLGLQHSGLVTPEAQQQVNKNNLALSTLTMLFLDSFRYQFAFYLPLTEKIIVPGQDETEDRYSKRVDGAIQTIFDNFNLRIQPLPEGTAADKAAVMFDTIKKVLTEGVQVPKTAMIQETEEPESVGESGDSPEEFTAATESLVDSAGNSKGTDGVIGATGTPGEDYPVESATIAE